MLALVGEGRKAWRGRVDGGCFQALVMRHFLHTCCAVLLMLHRGHAALCSVFLGRLLGCQFPFPCDLCPIFVAVELANQSMVPCYMCLLKAQAVRKARNRNVRPNMQRTQGTFCPFGCCTSACCRNTAATGLLHIWPMSSIRLGRSSSRSLNTATCRCKLLGWLNRFLRRLVVVM